jgi:hypothetical protein
MSQFKRVNKDFEFNGMSFNFDFWYDGGDYNLDITGNDAAAEQALQDDDFYDSIYAYVDVEYFADTTKIIL